MRTTHKFNSCHKRWRVLSQHYYSTLKKKNIVSSLKGKVWLIALNTNPFTEVVHEDHPSLDTETLSTTTYEYYMHVYLNANHPIINTLLNLYIK